MSYARFPNGTGNFQEMFPTFNSVNIDVTGLNELDTGSIQLTVYPNPANDFVNITLTNVNGSAQEVKIYNAIGKQVANFYMVDSYQFEVSTLSKGIYFIAIDLATKKLIIQ
ncbi:MAG: T9SS type A sorting domain-containing protein [Putridiphycobacter sp.]|nr:T9SS type A sorting domain-containing protein [Putridiphycobacter sp.]